MLTRGGHMDGTGTLKLRVVKRGGRWYKYDPEKRTYWFTSCGEGGWITVGNITGMSADSLAAWAEAKSDPYVKTVTRPRVKRIWGCDYRFVSGRFEVRYGGGWEPSYNTLGHPCMGDHLDAYHELMHNPTEVIEDHGEEVEA